MLKEANEAVALLNELELLPALGVLIGAVWFIYQPTARIQRRKEVSRK